MQIQKKQISNSRKIIAVIALLVILTAGWFATAKALNLFPFTKQDSPASRQDRANDVKIAKEGIANSSKTDVPVDTTTDEIPVSKSLQANITEASQNDSTVTFSANITNATKAGHCVITFSSANNRPVIKELEATTKSDGVAVCGPLAVSKLEFSYVGEWTVSLSYYEGNSQVTTKTTMRIS